MPDGLRSRRSPGPDLRTRLIHAGLRLVERSGASHLSLREVARRAGVSHMAPYSHFRNKSDLLAAIAVAGFGLLRDRLGAAARKHDGLPADQFLAAGLAYVEMSLEHPQLINLMFGGVIRPQDFTEALNAARGLAFADLATIVRDAMSSGAFRPGDPAAAAFAGWAIAHGFTQLAMGGELNSKLGVRTRTAQVTRARQILIQLVNGLRQA
jgi:AcrR family transcriptional regulator